MNKELAKRIERYIKAHPGCSREQLAKAMKKPIRETNKIVDFFMSGGKLEERNFKGWFADPNDPNHSP